MKSDISLVAWTKEGSELEPNLTGVSKIDHAKNLVIPLHDSLWKTLLNELSKMVGL